MRLGILPSLLTLSLVYSGSVAAQKSRAVYMGAGATYNYFHSDVGVSGTNDNVPPETGTKNLTLNKQFPNVNVFAGYRHNICDDLYFLSGDVAVSPLQDTLKKTNIPVLLGDVVGAVAVYQHIQLKVVRTFSAGVDLKIGRYFDKETAGFLSLGLLGSQFRITHRDDTPESVSNKKFVFGFAPGVGLRHYVKPRLPITFQYSYQMYNTFSTHNMDVSNTGSHIKYKFKDPRYHSFLVSLAWEF